MLTKLVALAAVIALSPITVIPAVLVLHAPRPRPTGLAFLAGWVLGLAGLTAVFVGGSGLLEGLHKAPPTWASWLRVALGSALIALGVYHWLIRHRHGDMPRWMRSFSTLTPARAGVTGAVLVVLRPEVLLVCVAAGLASVTAPWVSPASCWRARSISPSPRRRSHSRSWVMSGPGTASTTRWNASRSGWRFITRRCSRSSLF